jgi:hypothetical protein
MLYTLANELEFGIMFSYTIGIVPGSFLYSGRIGMHTHLNESVTKIAWLDYLKFEFTIAKIACGNHLISRSI